MRALAGAFETKPSKPAFARITPKESK
jgi:hypothetical protein